MRFADVNLLRVVRRREIQSLLPVHPALALLRQAALAAA